jgi:cytochrome c oxidase subunit 3
MLRPWAKIESWDMVRSGSCDPMALGALGAPGTELLPPPRTLRRKTRRRKGFGGPPTGRFGGDDRDRGRGGGGGGDDSGEGEDSRRAGAPDGASALGFAFFLLGIGTLFLTFLGAFLVLRQNSPQWPPAGSPRPPDGLWLSTLVLVLSSVSMAKASRAKARDVKSLRKWLARATLLGLLFLGVQTWLWRELFTGGLAASTNAYGAVFYSLTGLHALHVVGGLGFLLKVLASAYRDRSSGVDLCAVYWHFMGVIWLAVFAVLYFFS